MRSDSSGNWNWDTHIRDIKEEDFYHGISVQSYGNSNTIYEIGLVDGKWMFRATHKIIDRSESKLDCKLEKFPYCPFIHPVNTDERHPNRWAETHYSIKANLILIREEKLKELGI